MRIIAGKYKGHPLRYPKNNDHVRPTQDRVKEAVFSMLTARLEGACVLDLFCATGSLGLEALSRGADFAVFVDSDTQWVKQNTRHIDNGFQIVRGYLPKALKKLEKSFDVVFLDPPWTAPHLYGDSLRALGDFGILNPGAWVVCEHPRKMVLDPLHFHIHTQRHYGQTNITILTYETSHLSGEL